MSATGWKGWRPVSGSVSGSRIHPITMSTMPTPVRNQKIERQPRVAKSHPPITGATAGARPKKSVTIDMRRCASSVP